MSVDRRFLVLKNLHRETEHCYPKFCQLPFKTISSFTEWCILHHPDTHVPVYPHKFKILLQQWSKALGKATFYLQDCCQLQRRREGDQLSRITQVLLAPGQHKGKLWHGGNGLPGSPKEQNTGENEARTFMFNQQRKSFSCSSAANKTSITNIKCHQSFFSARILKRGIWFSPLQSMRQKYPCCLEIL